MNTFAVLYVCVQVCLVQSTFGRCVAGSRAILAGNGGSAGGYGVESYGGAGEGNVGVAGVLPVSGTATVGGRVPIVGAVWFSGPVAAHGQVTITGQCTCGCGCGPR